MSKPIVKVLYSPGTNCHHETAEAFRLAGGHSTICHLTADLISGQEKLSDCDLLAIPGGFSFGDHLAAGRIFMLDLVYRLKDQLFEVREKGIPILGICNGFQVLIDTGLLPGDSPLGEPNALLDRNGSAVFESRWVTIFMQETHCIWTKGISQNTFRIPVAHGEGRLIFYHDYDENQTVFRYGTPSGTEDYPENPNGSIGGRAGICDTTGRILGLMPHPERAVFPWLGSVDGLEIFRAGINSIRG